MLNSVRFRHPFPCILAFPPIRMKWKKVSFGGYFRLSSVLRGQHGHAVLCEVVKAFGKKKILIPLSASLRRLRRLAVHHACIGAFQHNRRRVAHSGRSTESCAEPDPARQCGEHPQAGESARGSGAPCCAAHGVKSGQIGFVLCRVEHNQPCAVHPRPEQAEAHAAAPAQAPNHRVRRGVDALPAQESGGLCFGGFMLPSSRTAPASRSTSSTRSLPKLVFVARP